VSPGKIIVVQPEESAFFDPEYSESPPPTQSREPSKEVMEIDSRPAPSQILGTQYVHPRQHAEHHQRHQSLQRMEASMPTLPSVSEVQSSITLAPLYPVPPRAPSNPQPFASPAMRPTQEISLATHPSPPELHSGLSKRWDVSSTASQMRSPTDLPHMNGTVYPRPPGEVSLDAIERMQTQISQNSGALAAHTRDIRRGEESFQQLETTFRREFAVQVQRQSVDISRVDEAVARLHLEMQSMRQILEGMTQELAATRNDRQRGFTAPLGQPAGIPDAALELMAQQVAAISHKTTEVDNLRVTVEIMKKKIHHLEQRTNSTPAPQTNPQFFQSMHGTPSAHAYTASPLQNQSEMAPQAISAISTPSSTQAPPLVGAPFTSNVPESVQRPVSISTQGTGWASINTGTKRTHSNGVGSPQDFAVHVPGSPKRQKLTAVDSEANYHSSQVQNSRYLHDDREGDSSNQSLRHFASPPTLPSQPSRSDSMTTPQTQPSLSTQYDTQEGPSDDSWRPQSQRIIEHRPRGRGRGGGPGSRGGRVRKSMPAQVHHTGTSEWERDEWQGVTDSQAGRDGFYNHVTHSVRGIARRGSGGGNGRGGYAQSDRAASLGSQGVSPGFSMGSPNDPYAHTKKTRSKPIRNSDGVLIRKDGRPDMRSQSSAANLRKVHSRKDGDLSTQGSPTGLTPTNTQYAVEAPDTPSPSGFVHPDENAPPSERQKHSAIMGKMFPSGVDESRKANDYARQVFDEDRDHTIRPHVQNHHNNAQTKSKADVQIKNEQHEQNRAAGPGLPNDEDAHMLDLEERVQISAPVQEVYEPMVPETQAVDSDSSHTVPASG
jgi:hypothetical protein